jgi:NAD(P)-dependent dehydrogenase (short-subunit alcohol dehydrogenase family)
MSERTWLITGVSSGFGRQLTEQLLERGDRVVGTVRNPDSVAALAQRFPDRWRAEILDVRDTATLRAVVDRTAANLQRIDVVVSNAGYGLFGAAEELSDEQIEAMIATPMPAYDDNPAHAFRAMLDPSAPPAAGDPARMAARIIESVDVDPAPLRMVLGSQALDSTLSTLRKRVADFESQNGLAASTDLPPGQ